MDLLIINPRNGRATLYRAAELRRDAQSAVKGKGRLAGYFVRVNDGAANGVSLVVDYKTRDGFTAQTSLAI